jgi:hypothetical protein
VCHELVVNVASDWSHFIRRKYHYGGVLEGSGGFAEKSGHHLQHGKKRHACRLCIYDPRTRTHYRLGYCDGRTSGNAPIGAELAYAIVDFVCHHRRNLVSHSHSTAARNDPPYRSMHRKREHLERVSSSIPQLGYLRHRRYIATDRYFISYDNEKYLI